MITFVLYFLAILSLVFGPAGLYMSLIELFPKKWVYYHYSIKKPINWSIFTILIIGTIFISTQKGGFSIWTILPLLFSAIGLLLTYKAHQSQIFKVIDFPKMADDISKLPIADAMDMAVIECEGITKCYPLNYVKNHHIINDKFNTKIIALTFCAHCNSFIPFDVTEIGPLFVGSMKDGNLIVADKKTASFFQQATFKSIAGKLHPSELTMIHFQVLPWKEVKKFSPQPKVVHVFKKDLKEFEILIKGVWEKIMKSEITLGVSRKNRNKEFPARTRVIGIIDRVLEKKIVYLKGEVVSKKVVQNRSLNFVLFCIGNSVIGFKSVLNNIELNISLQQVRLIDEKSKTEWNIQGVYIMGEIKENLEILDLSDEYWFSWKKFHPQSKLIRL